jgi:hypothetical protein
LIIDWLRRDQEQRRAVPVGRGKALGHFCAQIAGLAGIRDDVEEMIRSP